MLIPFSFLKNVIVLQTSLNAKPLSEIAAQYNINAGLLISSSH